MGQYLSTELPQNETGYLGPQNSRELSEPGKSVSPGYFKAGLIYTPTKRTSLRQPMILEDVYSKAELAAYSRFWAFLRSKRNKKKVINFKLFKLYLGLDRSYAPESLDWLTATLFSTLWCLKEYFYGAEIGRIHSVLNEISSTCPFNTDLINQIYLSRTDLLISLSVFLFDRPLHQNFYAFDKTPGSTLDCEEIWMLRVKLIMAAIIESEDNFVRKYDSDRGRSSIETHIKSAISANILAESDSQETDFEDIASTTPDTKSNSVDAFLELLKNAEREVLEFTQPANLLKIDVARLEYLIQSLYCLGAIKDIDKAYKGTGDSIPSAENKEFVSMAENLIKDLGYIATFIDRSIDRAFPGMFGAGSIESLDLNFPDLIKWINYCGTGIFMPLAKFLTYKILKVPTLITELNDFDFKNADFSVYDGYESEVKLENYSGIISRPALFLLSMKALPRDKKYKFTSTEKITSSKMSMPNSMYGSQLQFYFQSLTRQPSFAGSLHEGVNATTVSETTDIPTAPKAVLENGWDKLFSTHDHGFGMNCLTKHALHYDAPTVLFVSGTVLEDSDFARPSMSKSYSSKSQFISPPSRRSTANLEQTPTFKPGDTIKIGVYLATKWVESENATFGDETSFMFITEPFFMLLPSTTAPRENTSFSFEKNVFAGLNQFGESDYKQSFCYAACSQSSGLRFGGINNSSKTSKVLSSSLAPSKEFKDTTMFKLDVASEQATFINDPFLPAPNPIYSLLSSTVYFKIHFSLSLIELYGLGGTEALENQKENVQFDNQDAYQRRSLKMQRQNSLTAKSFGNLNNHGWSMSDYS